MKIYLKKPLSIFKKNESGEKWRILCAGVFYPKDFFKKIQDYKLFNENLKKQDFLSMLKNG